MMARQRMDFSGNCAREKVNSKQMLKNDAKRMAKLREGTSETLELMVDFKGLAATRALTGLLSLTLAPCQLGLKLWRIGRHLTWRVCVRGMSWLLYTWFMKPLEALRFPYRLLTAGQEPIGYLFTEKMIHSVALNLDIGYVNFYQFYSEHNVDESKGYPNIL